MLKPGLMEDPNPNPNELSSTLSTNMLFKSGRNIPTTACLDYQDVITRDEITPYDLNFLERDITWHRLNSFLKELFDRLKMEVEFMVEGQFKWDEDIFTQSWKNDLLLVCKTFNNQPEKQLIDLVDIPHFSNLIDPFVTRILIESSQEIFENPERLFNLDLISQFFEFWIKISLYSDTNYFPKIDSRHIQIMNPFMRTNIRNENKKNSYFKRKYLSRKFNIKDFIYDNLERFFETNKVRALMYGLKRMRLNLLKLITFLFEIGLWETSEQPLLLETIHNKLQLLFNEENEYGDEFVADDGFSAYSSYYHENIASIINQSIMLSNDEAFMSIFVEENSNGDAQSAKERIQAGIKKLYFNKKELFNLIGFTLFDGIQHSVSGDMSHLDQATVEKELYSSRSTFMNVFDIPYDSFVLSTKYLNAEKINEYEKLMYNYAESTSGIGVFEGKASSTNLTNIYKCKKELEILIRDMKAGRIYLDPKVPFRQNNVENPQVNVDNLRVIAESHSRGIAFTPQMVNLSIPANSVLPKFKSILDELYNIVWLMKKSRNKCDLLIVSQTNLVLMIQRLIDYLDRNQYRFRKKKVENLLNNEDEYLDEQDDYDDEEDGESRASETNGADKVDSSKSNKSGRDSRPNLEIPLNNLGGTSKKIDSSYLMKDIKSLKCCVNRRQKQSAFPESTEIVLIGLKILQELCLDSIENKALLFNEDGWYHLERIYMKHPIRVLYLLNSLFKFNKDLLMVDLSITLRIFILYKAFCKKIMNRDMKSQQTCDAVLSFCWNMLIATIVSFNTRDISITQVIHFNFKVQEIFNEKQMIFIFQNILNENGLVMNEKRDGLQFPFKMIGQKSETLITMFIENEYYVGPEQGILNMEIAYSFLKLLNRSTRDVYAGEMLKMARESFKHLEIYEDEIQHEWLYKFKEGMIIRGEIQRFYRQFFIFHTNHLITPDSYTTDYCDAEYDRIRFVPKSHVTENGVIEYIINEIKATKYISIKNEIWTEDKLEVYIDDYFVKNQFLTIYKYMMGVYKLYHCDEFHKDLAKAIKKLITNLFKYAQPAFVKLQEEYPQIIVISAVLSCLNKLKSDFEEFSKSTRLYKIDGQELEDEDINKKPYYNQKRYIVILLSAIEDMYKKLGLYRRLEKYLRLAYHVKEPDMNQLFVSEDLNMKYSINLLNFEQRNNISGPETLVPYTNLGNFQTKAIMADMFRIKYIESKKQTLLLKPKTILRFMENPAGHHDISETFQEFLESSIINISPDCYTTQGQINNFWLDPFYYCCIRVWNNMMCESMDVRQTITDKMDWVEFTHLQTISDAQRMMSIFYKTYLDLQQIITKKTFQDRNYKELWDVYFNISDIFKNVCEKNNRICKLFFNKFGLFVNLGSIEDDDDDYESIFEQSQISHGGTISPVKIRAVKKENEITAEEGIRRQQLILDTICNKEITVENKVDMDNANFQEGYQDGGENQIGEENRIVEKNNQEMVAQFMSKKVGVIIRKPIIMFLKEELFITLSYLSSNMKRHTLTRKDHPELYYTVGRQFDVICEFMNGPCSENQSVFQESFIEKNNVEILLNIIKRNITDLDSEFLYLQSKAVTLLLALFEGGYKEAINIISEKLDPNHLFKLMIDYTKRFYIQTNWNSKSKAKKYERLLRIKGTLKDNVDRTVHYKPKVYDLEFMGAGDQKEKVSNFNNMSLEGQLTDEQKNKSIRMLNAMKRRKSVVSSFNPSTKAVVQQLHTEGDVVPIKDTGYNIWIDSTQKTLRHYFKIDYKIDNPQILKKHYLSDFEYGQSPVMELVRQFYALLKSMELNQKFKGFLKKKTDDMKKYYWKQPHIEALMTQEEIDMHKSKNKGSFFFQGKKAQIIIPEDITIYCFQNDVCQSVELINALGEKKLAYFPMLPKVYYLTNNSIQEFRASCRIDQASTKVMDLMLFVEQFDIEMKVNYELNEQYNKISKLLSDDSFKLFQKTLWVIGLQMNLTVIRCYSIVDGELGIPKELLDEQNMIDLLSAIQLSWSFVIINLWLVFRYDSIRMIEREKFIIKDPGIDSTTQCNRFTISFIQSIFNQPAPMNFIQHFQFTIMSYISSPFFFSLHLLLIINISQTAKFVVKSITYRFSQILLTFILAIFIIYAYSVLTITNYRKYFGSDYPVDICDTLYSCFLYSINLGLRNGGGLGDSFDILEFNDNNFSTKLVFDISFYMLVNIVSLNIIFGIIIDTFAEMRDAQNTRDEDICNICFICGHSRDQFEKEGQSFDRHVKYEHNLIQYVNFIIYLRDKPSDEFDGTEEYVFTQYKKKKTNWAPIENTRYINIDDDDDDEDKHDANFDTIDMFIESQKNTNDNMNELMGSMHEKMDILSYKLSSLGATDQRKPSQKGFNISRPNLNSKNEISPRKTGRDMKVDNQDFSMDQIDIQDPHKMADKKNIYREVNKTSPIGKNVVPLKKITPANIAGKKQFFKI